MAIAFPASPTNLQVFTDSTSNKTWVYNSTQQTWESKNYAIYDIAGGIPGTPTASQEVARFDIARSVLFPVSFGGSYWNCDVAPAAQAVFSVGVNGTEIGTIVFAAGATTATFTTVSAGSTQVNAGSTLTITAPATADTALSQASGTLAGILV